VPCPYLDYTPIVPLKALTIFSQITKPKPIPYVFNCFVFYRQPKSLKSLVLSFFLIPTPVSVTEITILSLPFIGSNIFYKL
jgi:hypothetical protein